jgi:hypothetical protein
LRDELEKRGLDTKGTKPFLIERLKVHLFIYISIYLSKGTKPFLVERLKVHLFI